MEAMLFMMDALAVVAMVFTSLKNDRLAPGEKQIGPFRFFESPEADPAQPMGTRLSRRVARRASRL